MKKRSLAIIIAVALILSLIPGAALAHGGYSDVHANQNDLFHIKSRIEAGAGGTIDSPGWQVDAALLKNVTWTFTAVPDLGYEFAGWTFSGNEVSGAFSSNGTDLSVKFTESGSWVSTGFLRGYWDYAEYKAQATFVYVGLPTYDVTLDLGAGGTFDSNNSNSITVSGSPGDTFSVPAYSENAGYDLVGWSGSLEFDSTKTLSAKYEYLITFAGNDHISITGANLVWTVHQDVTAPSYSVDSADYRFDGWDRSLNNFTAPTTVTANPAVRLYTLTLEVSGDGHFLNEGAVEGKHDEGDYIKLIYSLPTPYITGGARFIGWRLEGTSELLDKDIEITLGGDCTYIAVFGEYLGTSAGDYGTLGNDLDGWLEKGTQINLNDALPTGITGYTLDCWREFDGTNWDKYDGYGSEVTLTGGKPIITIGDQNLFRAFFKEAVYTISYDLAEGSVSPENPGSYTINSADITLNNPIRTGYTFAGWTSDDLAAPTMSVTIPAGSTGDRSYTATWTANTYTVTYDINTGDGGTTADSAHVYDTESGLTVNGFTKTGYTFDGWNTMGDGSGTAYADGANVINLADENGATVTLYAMWKINTYTVTFVGHDGTVLKTQTVDWNTAAAAPSAPRWTGHTFKRWDTPFSAVTSDITVKAQYSINKYTVTFVDYDGTVIEIQSVNWNDGADTPEPPEREGYTFIGWDKSYDPVTASITVTALYRINTYTVTFTDYNGSVLKTQTVDWNTAASAPAAPSREGYEFTGWDLTFSAVTSDITVTAQYRAVEVIQNEPAPGSSDSTNIEDENVPQTGPQPFVWWWIPVAAGALIALFLIIFFARRKKSSEA